MNAMMKNAQTPATHAPSTLIAGKDVKNFVVNPPIVDVRGWEVVGYGDVKLGSVDRIMLDTAEMRPRYLSVTPLDGAGSWLIPIGIGSLDAVNKQWHLKALKPEVLTGLPRLTDEVTTVEFEQQVFALVTGKPVNGLTASQRYADPVFDASRLFKAELKAPTQKA